SYPFAALRAGSGPLRTTAPRSLRSPRGARVRRFGGVRDRVTLSRTSADGHAAALDGWDPKIGTYDWLKPLQETASRGGKMYTMPVNSGAPCLFYNKEVGRGTSAEGEDPDRAADVRHDHG